MQAYEDDYEQAVEVAPQTIMQEDEQAKVIHSASRKRKRSKSS